MKDKYVKVCSRCGSTNITTEIYWMGICGDCGLNNVTGVPLPKGTFAPILEIRESKLSIFRKQIKKKPIVK